MPVRLSRKSVSSQAIAGSRRMRPANVDRLLVTPVRRWRATTTANAPRFMTAYAAP